MNAQHYVISIPRHPDDAHIPNSTMHIVLPSGKIATVSAPLFSRTMEMLHDTLLICKDAIVQKPDDYNI